MGHGGATDRNDFKQNIGSEITIDRMMKMVDFRQFSAAI
jgi:hypothetical protein